MVWAKPEQLRSVYTVLEDGLDSHPEGAAELNLFDVSIIGVGVFVHLPGKLLQKCNIVATIRKNVLYCNNIAFMKSEFRNRTAMSGSSGAVMQ